MADELAKQAAANSDIKDCYDSIPKLAVKIEVSEIRETKWQTEWDRTTKGVTTELCFPKVADSLKLKINVTPNLTKMVTGRGNIKSHLYKYKIIDSSLCPCKIGEQTAEHILHDCELVKQERDKLKAETLRSENWPVSKDTLINKYTKIFKIFVDSIPLEKLQIIK